MDVRSLERSGDVAALRGGGELLLIGPWNVFQGVSQSLIIRDPARLRTVLYPHLRDDASLAKLAALYRRLICTGSVAGHYSPQQTTEQMMALMQVGQIAAVALPDTSGNDGNGNVQPAVLSGNPVGPVTQWSLADRFSYVLNKSPQYMPAALGNELLNALSGRSLAIVVGVLVVWAGSHAIGVGFVADAALLAIGFTLAGWAIFDGIKYLMRFFNLTMNASSTGELDQAAEQFAKGVIAMGVGAVIALLTRGANRLAPRPLGRSTPRPSAETPQTPRQATGPRPAETVPSTPDSLRWGSWNDYPKVAQGDRTYAQIGDRLYSQHAVDRMQPSGLGAPAGTVGAGRNISPNIVEHVIRTGEPTSSIVNGVTRTTYWSGNVGAVTENGGNTVVTLLRRGGQ
ncbi:hypothetical protein [Bordetella sp. BOR01]|uniref:hypothetical protein n=1 Tax=Bordetella sp. BOR01 TaxID=2854779 RepID=UPI001C46CDC8|nr:hypothetical protein [Bordetella sp. BOR01]MBV7485431.1 hypothetical protein [Bordetella sp. BOR01]